MENKLHAQPQTIAPFCIKITCFADYKAKYLMYTIFCAKWWILWSLKNPVLKRNLAQPWEPSLSLMDLFLALRNQKPPMEPSEWDGIIWKYSYKEKKSAWWHKSSVWSVILLGSVESSRQVVERECPQVLPKPYGKKKKRTIKNTFYYCYYCYFCVPGRKQKAKLSGKVGEL